VPLVLIIPQITMRGKDVTPTVKVSILAQLHKSANATNGTLAHGEKRRVAVEHGVDAGVVGRLWKRHRHYVILGSLSWSK
jgi:hypothetical protein